MIIDARLAEKSICQLEEKDFRWSVDQVIMRASAMFGCLLPQTEFYAEIVSDELSAFLLKMGYSELNLQEIFLALRLNSTVSLQFPSGIEYERTAFLGGNFNINFISKILSNYMQLRNLLDRKFQNLIDGHE